MACVTRPRLSSPRRGAITGAAIFMAALRGSRRRPHRRVLTPARMTSISAFFNPRIPSRSESRGAMQGVIDKAHHRLPFEFLWRSGRRVQIVSNRPTERRDEGITSAVTDPLYVCIVEASVRDRGASGRGGRVRRRTGANDSLLAIRKVWSARSNEARRRNRVSLWKITIMFGLPLLAWLRGLKRYVHRAGLPAAN